MTAPAEPAPPRRTLNPRVILLLLLLLALISASVILTDHFAIRDRHLNDPPAAKGTRP